MKLIRQPLISGDIHHRYRTEDGKFEIIPAYAGHGYSKPTHYYTRTGDNFEKSCSLYFDKLREAREHFED
jgi:hypothetical protein